MIRPNPPDKIKHDLATRPLYRIEDARHRGPFAPGFSHHWRSPTGNDFPPPWEEAGLTIPQFRKLFSEGFRGGCACVSRQMLRRWFSSSERKRLAQFGYREVRFVPDRIVLETPTQVVFEVRQ